jgi:hypothetical protein
MCEKVYTYSWRTAGQCAPGGANAPWNIPSTESPYLCGYIEHAQIPRNLGTVPLCTPTQRVFMLQSNNAYQYFVKMGTGIGGHR